jgi:cystathionine gamma-lyase
MNNNSTPPEHGFDTRAIHVGQDPEPITGALSVPIFQTSTYAQPAVGEHTGFEYSRTRNPTRDAFEACLASMESGAEAIAFASGLAAISTIMTLFEAGDHIVSSDDVYGGTFRVFDKVFRDFGLRFTYVDTTSLEAVEAAMEERTRMVWVETPTNPMLKVTSIADLAASCAAKGVLLGVDNTFMSPFFQRPLEHGADLVMHSTTKYLGGHSDVVGGVVAARRSDVLEKLRFAQNAMGAIPGPFDSWLTLRGMKTLGLRMRRHESNAFAVARYMEKHTSVESVIYPGLESHPGHECQRAQADGFGGMLSVILKGDLNTAKTFCGATKLFFLAESLGGVESLIEHPAIMTHASIPADARTRLGISDTLVRLSCGIEDPADLIFDIEQALSTAN